MADVTEPVSLAEAKLHLRINPGDSSEDGLIKDLITASREYCENYTSKALVGTDEDGEPVDVPKTIKQALLLLIAHWYTNREAVVATNVVPREVALTVDALLNQYRKWWF